MITINSALKQAEIQALLTQAAGDVQFTFVDQQGMRLRFEVTGDPATAAQAAKALIKAAPWGSSIYFTVTTGG